MTPRSICADKEALVAYLYGEGTPAERDAVEAHLSVCETCAGELAALGSVRRELPRWQPPDTEPIVPRLGPAGAARAGWRAASWWGLAAAALLVAAVGAAVANLDVRVGADGLTVRTGWNRTAVPAAAADEAPWRSELAALEERLRQELARPAATAAPMPAAAPGRDEALVGRVRALIEESEARQQRELALRVAQITREIEAQRQADLLQIRQGFGTLAGMTGAEVARQRELMNYLIRVSQRE